MSIRQLPDDVIDKLKSSVVITSLNGVVVGLVKNSLDATATRINISVDYARGNCTVEDDGSGVLPAEFETSGGLGKLHHTSKHPQSDTVYGQRGDFLASLATFSLLSISSRHRRHVSHNSIVIHKSEVIGRYMPAPKEHKLRAFEHGTRVTVRDLFGSLPVRVKQRGMLFSERQNVDKYWWELLRAIVAVLISWPSSISLYLNDPVTQREVRLRSPNGSDIHLRSSRIISQAFLVNSKDEEAWVPVSASTGSMIVKGCISTNPVATRRWQFISIGIEPLDNKEGANILYEEVNKVFSNSDFGIVPDVAPCTSLELPDNTIPPSTQLKPRKGIERWPTFFFQIHGRLPGEMSDADAVVNSNPQELLSILELLRAVCYGFLKQHHYRPRKNRSAAKNTAESSNNVAKGAKRTSSWQNDLPTASKDASPGRRGNLSYSKAGPFDDWPRLKVSETKRASKSDIRSEAFSSGSAQAGQVFDIVAPEGSVFKKPLGSPSDVPGHEHETLESSYFEQGTAPRTVDSASATQLRDEFPGHSLTNAINAPSEWLQGLLDRWENPVFENAPASIPRSYNDAAFGGQSCYSGTRSRYFGGNVDETNIMFESASMNLSGRISKVALRGAEVVSQVDQKFILAKLPIQSSIGEAEARASSALIMLDQHAVDERCQLEDLMNGYFVPSEHEVNKLQSDTKPLDPRLMFEVSKEEAYMLQQQQVYFSVWGVNIEMGEDIQAKLIGVASGRGLYVTVKSLPPSILERCRLEPRLIIDLLRNEIWHKSELTRSSLPDFSSRTNLVSNFHGCPQGILELLHSRACRSATMFNDPLSHQECVALVERLSHCTFPFQCAHGRPSMVPLVGLGEDSRVGGWYDDKGTLPLEKWKASQGG